ncbi:hypothetical protein KI387_043896 [Taxus chinensis]|uniref:Aminotransferase-like plant mobile domain-containing protein n=1 Tax=Taxus chinensis TaxID=29808 RepID=A0AA38FET8_TAXCH|nr:hypothetical protein KI387_043896 [Taxus chinensis]
MYTTGQRTSIDVSFVLHCWAYEHIVVIRPSGLPWMPAAVGAIDYGFRRWRADMASIDTRRSADWYTERFRMLTSEQVIWRPYWVFPTWAGQDAHLVALRRSRVVRGRRPDMWERILFMWVLRQFGLVQTVPTTYRPYRRDSRETDLPIFIPADPLREAPPSIDSDDDTGVGDGDAAWYATELPRHLLASIDSDEEDMATVLERFEGEHATLTQTHQAALEEIRALTEERDALILERDTTRQDRDTMIQ